MLEDSERARDARSRISLSCNSFIIIEAIMRRTNGRGGDVNGTRPIVTLGYGFRAISRLASVHVSVYSTSTIGASARS